MLVDQKNRAVKDDDDELPVKSTPLIKQAKTQDNDFLGQAAP